MKQLMGINGEKNLFLEHELFRNWTNEWKTKTGKTPCAWCKRLWRAFDAVPAGNSRASSGFSACHIIPLSGCIHRKAINRKKLFLAGTASYLWIHQVQSRSDWAAVRWSRWLIHRATIERFISVYRLEENGSLLKEGTGDAVGWALRACSYKTKTEASQQRRSRHTLQGVFLVFFPPFSFYHFVSSSLCLFDSSSLWLFVSSINETINGH